MRVKIDFPDYNRRRFSKPWIAKVSEWLVGEKKPELAWGSYIGNDKGGYVEIDANPGDIVRWGQLDNRGNRTTRFWGIVEADGSVKECTEGQAKDHYFAQAES